MFKPVSTSLRSYLSAWLHADHVPPLNYVQACCHNNIFTWLKGVSLFKAPYRPPQDINGTFLELKAAENNIPT